MAVRQALLTANPTAAHSCSERAGRSVRHRTGHFRKFLCDITRRNQLDNIKIAIAVGRLKQYTPRKQSAPLNNKSRLFND